MRRARIVIQIVFLAFFIALFAVASYPLTSQVPVDLFFRLDPVTSIATMLASHKLIATGLLALVIIALTIPLGRVFCGWVCPLGTALDITDRMIRAGNRYSRVRFRNIKYYLLALLLAASILGAQYFYFFDPLPILNRGLVIVLLPLVNSLAASVLSLLFRAESLQDFLADLQFRLSSTVLPVERMSFDLSVLVFLLVGAVFALGLLTRRFWCQSLCPLGALLAFFSRYQLFKRRVTDECTECDECRSSCKMNCIPEDTFTTDHAECILCYNCTDACPAGANPLSFSRPKPRKLGISRRRFTIAAAAGVAVAGMETSLFANRETSYRAIRPPGSREEDEFAARCIRCHQCIKVCSTSGDFLQPSLFETGLAGFLTPIGIAREGFCEYNCILCTEVCPTGAIKRLTVPEKQQVKIGLAYIDKDRCIPYISNKNCIVCEEHCPTPQKAIVFDREPAVDDYGNEIELLKPKVLDDLCIGCGICETKCPIQGRSAIIITRQNEQRFSD